MSRRLAPADARRRLVHFAHKHLGKPYVYGAPPSAAPRQFDCSSFTQYLYRRVGIHLPRTALEQAKVGRRVRPHLRNLKPGDLLFFSGGWGRYDPDIPEGVGHVAMYAGNDWIIHAKFSGTEARPRGRVRRDRVAPWVRRRDLVVIRRIYSSGRTS